MPLFEGTASCAPTIAISGGIMLPDVIEIRAKIKEFKDRLELLRGHL